MFSHLSENRFPKDCSCSGSTVGPGSYDILSPLDERSTLNLTCSSLDVSRRLDDSICSFSIFVDDTMEGPRTPATARAPAGTRTLRGTHQVPFGRSMKENIVANASVMGNCFDTAADSKSSDLAATKKVAANAFAKLQVKERHIAELQKKVEELARTNRDWRSRIAGLEAEKEEFKKASQELAGPGEPLTCLREQLIAVVAEKEQLERALLAVAAQSKGPQALTTLVAELVAHELSDARRVLSLQRTAWERQTKELQQQSERLERKMEQRDQEREKHEEVALARAEAAESRATAAAELAQRQQQELTRLHEAVQASRAEAQSLGQLVGTLRGEKQDAVDASQGLRAVLELAQLEEQRLGEVAAAAQESMERCLDREAKLAGHVNHKQKIHITLDLKKENCALRSEVQRLQQQLNRQAPRQQPRPPYHSLGSPAPGYRSAEAVPAAASPVHMMQCNDLQHAASNDVCAKLDQVF